MSRASRFQRWMDRIAEKRPNGLVARFRRTFGKLEPEDLDKLADKLIEQAKKAKRK